MRAHCESLKCNKMGWVCSRGVEESQGSHQWKEDWDRKLASLPGKQSCLSSFRPGDDGLHLDYKNTSKTTIDYDNDFREELELGCIEGKSNMDVEAQVMSRNSMASGLPLKKFLISGPSSSMKKQDLGNILITNPVSNQRAHEEFQIRNHMLAAVSESDGFSDLLWKSVIGY